MSQSPLDAVGYVEHCVTRLGISEGSLLYSSLRWCWHFPQYSVRWAGLAQIEIVFLS